MTTQTEEIKRLECEALIHTINKAEDEYYFLSNSDDGKDKVIVLYLAGRLEPVSMAMLYDEMFWYLRGFFLRCTLGKDKQ